MSNDQPKKIGCNQLNSESDTMTQIIQQKLQPEINQKRNLNHMKVLQIFLLEVLVNSIEVKNEELQTDEPSPLCVKVTFIDLPSLNICEDDFYGVVEDEPKPETKTSSPTPPSRSVVSEKPSHENPKPAEKKSSIKKTTDKKADKKASDEFNKSKRPDTPDSGRSIDSGKKSIKSEKSTKSETKKASKGPARESPKSIKKSQKETKPNSKDLGSGKSCMFSLQPMELIIQIQRFPLTIQVFRKTTEQMLPIGQCKIRLGTQFEDNIIKAVYHNDPLPLMSVQESDTPLTNNDNVTGRISIFVRLSCFGTSIVTETLLREHQEYVFKTTNNQPVEAHIQPGYLYNADRYKTENIVKPLAHRKGVNPYKSSDESINIDSDVKSMNCIEYEDIAINKTARWRKYVHDCGCENLHEDWLGLGSCAFESQSTIYCCQQNQPNARPPCPLADCDCYGTDEPLVLKQKTDMCQDCDCNFNPYQNRSCCPKNNNTLLGS